MSYILDALKKADAEREQGRVPGLHTPTANLESDLPPLRGRPPAWVMGLGAVLVLTTMGSAWWWMRPVATATPTSMLVPSDPQTALAQAPQTPPNTAAPGLTPPATSTLPAPTPAPAPVLTPPPVVASPVTPPPVVRSPMHSVPPSVPPTEHPPVVTPARTSSPAPIAKPTSPAAQPPIHVDPAPTNAASAHVPTLAELPDDMRRSLPALTVSGAMYSDQPASRMLLINNRVFHEGDQPVAGLVLEEIRLKSAVFRYRGTRYAVSY